MTYIIINEATDKILHRSQIKLTSIDPNRRVDTNQNPHADINIPNHSTIDTTNPNAIDDDSHNSDSDNEAPPSTESVNPTNIPTTKMAIIDAEDLFGRTYLT